MVKWTRMVPVVQHNNTLFFFLFARDSGMSERDGVEVKVCSGERSVNNAGMKEKQKKQRTRRPS